MEPLPGPSGHQVGQKWPPAGPESRLWARAERHVEAGHPKAPREPHRHTILCQPHGLLVQVSFENDFRGLASLRPQLTLLFEKGENDPSAPIETWQKNLQNSFRNENSQA